MDVHRRVQSAILRTNHAGTTVVCMYPARGSRPEAECEPLGKRRPVTSHDVPTATTRNALLEMYGRSWVSQPNGAPKNAVFLTRRHSLRAAHISRNELGISLRSADYKSQGESVRNRVRQLVRYLHITVAVAIHVFQVVMSSKELERAGRRGGSDARTQKHDSTH